MEPSDNLPFGKHKGTRVEEALANDPGWFLWLRHQRVRDGDPKAQMSDEIHALLDDYYANHAESRDKMSFRRSSTATQREDMARCAIPAPTVTVTVVAEVPEEVAEAIEAQPTLEQPTTAVAGWGEW